MIQIASSIITAAPTDPWFVVWTEARAEKKVAERFGAAGHHVWLPTYTSRRRWSDRWKEVVQPLFSGYCFARPQSENWQGLLRTPGVLTLVKEGGAPARLADDYVSSLRRTIETPELEPEPVPDFESPALGSEVVVQEGPLAGFRGVVREVRSGRKLIVWVATIGRGVAFTIGAAKVRSV